MSKKIMTMNGPIVPEALGPISMHEHILMNGRILRSNSKVKDSPIDENEPMRLDNVGIISHNGMLTWDAVDLQDEELMMGEVGDYKMAGGQSMLDVTAIGIRTDMAAVKRIADANGVQVVACTGFYVSKSWPEKYKGKSVAELAKVMYGEIEYGIENTGILPGVLKIGMGPFTQDEERALRAAAQVAKDTGLSLTIHPSEGLGTDALHDVRVIKEEGLATERVVIAHMGGSWIENSLKTLIMHPESWRMDMSYAKRLLDTGVTICTEFLGQNVSDELGGSVGTNDWQRLAGIYALIRQGYAKQIVLGTDLCCKMLTRRYGGEGYLRLWNFALPTLRDLVGVPQSVLDQIMIHNPARILAY
jgi:phosphotriesterase-related protein